MMKKKIVVISGSPKKAGNTAALIRWFGEGVAQAADISMVHAAALSFKACGCTSCRVCQKKTEYGCVIEDDGATTLRRMIEADVIVMATPLYFFAASAPLKAIIDRMFSLYKWDNAANTMKTVLTGKTLVLLASAYEDAGLDCLARPFQLTADYSGMRFESLLVPRAGVSGEIVKQTGVREQAIALGKKVAV